MESDAMSGICKNCFWWVIWREQINSHVPAGDCRIRPPEQFQHEDGKIKTKWPPTRATDFCGQFKPK
jgi:hypothetical protein